VSGGPVLQVTELHKSYGANNVLRGVDLELHAGQATALVGENGAGKSTLVGVLAGKAQGWTGEYRLRGQRARFGSVRAAQRAGISLIHQETTCLPTMTVAENVLAGRLPRRAGLLRRRALREQARAALAVLGVTLDVDRPASALTTAELQLVDIARALLHDPAVLLLDEPTASLPDHDRDRLFGVLRGLLGRGTAIVLISHHLSEVFDLCDRVVALRDGRVVLAEPVRATSPQAVATAMLGASLAAVEKARSGRPIGPPRLRVRDVADGVSLHGVGFDVHAAEILGVTGLLGAGQQELVAALIGHRRVRGAMELDGVPWRPRNPAAAVRGGAAVLTEDRKADGLLLDSPVSANLALASSLRRPLARYSRRAETAAARRLVDELGVRPADPGRPVAALSGGNQQKVALGKWLREPRSLVILHEPTRGVDVGAKATLHTRIRQLAATGAAVVLVSSDLPEVAALADRAIVLRRGRIARELAGPQLTEETLLLAAASDLTAPAAPVEDHTP
jgi:ABC-type sugar transport system ATPase subunit